MLHCMSTLFGQEKTYKQTKLVKDFTCKVYNLLQK